MNDNQFTKLFKYIEDFRSEVNERFNNTASRDSMDHLVNTLDGFLKRLDDNETEQSARDLQFDRLLE
jgi:hypothetical protein